MGLTETDWIFAVKHLKFSMPELFGGLQAAIPSFTDDASVMEAAGHRIRLVEGHRKNSKITVPEDLLLAEYWLKQSK